MATAENCWCKSSVETHVLVRNGSSLDEVEKMVRKEPRPAIEELYDVGQEQEGVLRYFRPSSAADVVMQSYWTVPIAVSDIVTCFPIQRKVCHREAVHREGTGQQFAAKYLRKRRGGKSCRPDIMMEVDIVRQCMHHNRIVKLHEVFESTREMIIVLEL